MGGYGSKFHVNVLETFYLYRMVRANLGNLLFRAWISVMKQVSDLLDLFEHPLGVPESFLNPNVTPACPCHLRPCRTN